MREFTSEWRKKLSESAKRRYKEGRNHNLLTKNPNPKRGSNSPSWRGDKISYSGLHTWLRQNFPKSGICEECKKPARTDWANLGNYTRNREDYKELCRSCHFKMDGQIKNITRSKHLTP